MLAILGLTLKPITQLFSLGLLQHIMMSYCYDEQRRRQRSPSLKPLCEGKKPAGDPFTRKKILLYWTDTIFDTVYPFHTKAHLTSCCLIVRREAVPSLFLFSPVRSFGDEQGVLLLFNSKCSTSWLDADDLL